MLIVPALTSCHSPLHGRESTTSVFALPYLPPHRHIDKKKPGPTEHLCALRSAGYQGLIEDAACGQGLHI